MKEDKNKMKSSKYYDYIIIIIYFINTIIWIANQHLLFSIKKLLFMYEIAVDNYVMYILLIIILIFIISIIFEYKSVNKQKWKIKINQ